MKHSAQKIGLFAGVLFMCFAANAFAAETQSWRPTYDFVMRWVNFAIMAFLFFKFAWGPLTRWLRGQGDEVAAQLKDMEEKKQAILEKMAETKEQIQQRSQYLEELMARTTENARKDKEQIVEQAKAEGAQMIQDAKQRADYQIAAARKQFRAELIDEAVELASQKLPGIISSDDENKIQTDYLAKALQ